MTLSQAQVTKPKFRNLPSRLALVAALSVMAPMTVAQTFNDTGNILARSAEVKDIEYQIMVQRATQTAI